MTEQTRFLSHECINLLPGLHIKNKSRPTFNNCFGPVPQSIITATAALLINHVMRGELFFLKHFGLIFFKLTPEPQFKCTKRAIFCIWKLGWWHGFGANDNSWRREVASAPAGCTTRAPPRPELEKNWAPYWTELENCSKDTTRVPPRPELEIFWA